jgi:hypothetical protein
MAVEFDPLESGLKDGNGSQTYNSEQDLPKKGEKQGPRRFKINHITFGNYWIINSKFPFWHDSCYQID